MESKAIFSGIEDGNGDDNNINSNNNSTVRGNFGLLNCDDVPRVYRNVCAKLRRRDQYRHRSVSETCSVREEFSVETRGETNPHSHELNRFSEKVSQALKRGLATIEISEVIENELPAVLRAYNLRFREI